MCGEFLDRPSAGPLSRTKFRSFLLSLGSSRGIVAACRGHGPPKLCVWASLGSFCVSPGPRTKSEKKRREREKREKGGPGEWVPKEGGPGEMGSQGRRSG